MNETAIVQCKWWGYGVTVRDKSQYYLLILFIIIIIVIIIIIIRFANYLFFLQLHC